MFNEEIRERVLKIYSNDPETAKRILEGDREVIQRMGIGCRFESDDIIDAYENNKIEELYQKAKRQKEIEKLYHDLCYAIVDHNDVKSI